MIKITWNSLTNFTYKAVRKNIYPAEKYKSHSRDRKWKRFYALAEKFGVLALLFEWIRTSSYFSADSAKIFGSRIGNEYQGELLLEGTFLLLLLVYCSSGTRSTHIHTLLPSQLRWIQRCSISGNIRNSRQG